MGDILSGLFPANLVALALHQRNELLAVGSVAHTVIDDIHELQLLALTTGRRVILSDGHSLCFLLLFPGLKYRK